MKLDPRHLVLALSLLIALLFSITPVRADDAARPAVLICSPRGAWGAHVDVDWLRDLHAAGFEPDYLDAYTDFTWDRIRQYHCLVIYGCPAADARKAFGFPERGPRQQEYVETIERFLEAGGGVFMMADTDNADQHVKPLIEPWGARLPLETYVEDDESKTALMPRMRGYEYLVLVDQVRRSPITEGVRNLWLPYGPRYNSSWTAPIAVSDDWEVVVKGSKTSRSAPVDTAASSYAMPAPPDALVRPGGVPEPDLVALREYGNGRIVLLCQAPAFTIGQGTQWLYNRRSLSKGLNEIPSDFERLVMNAFRWLSAPARKSDTLGGYRADANRFLPPNLQPGVKEEFERVFWSEEELDLHRPPAAGRVYRGLIGAQSAAGGGEGTVQEYAEAAREAGLDFVAFMEAFAHLTEESFEALNAACREASGDDLLMLPGYKIDTNVGNHMFFTGYDLPWPRDDVLVGPDRKILMIQFQDETGAFVKGPNTFLQWVLYEHNRSKAHMVGVFDFDDPRAMQVADLKLTSAVAVKTYRGGELVDERTDEYLVSLAGTLPSLPVAVNEVRSPAELIAEARSGHALTFAQGTSLETLPRQALHWNSQYDGMNVFASDGPIIRAWPQCYRAYTYGAESFAVDYELMPSDLHVTSEVGLAEIKVMNADRMIRRFLPQGAKEFRQVLHLPGNVQQNLAVIARDTAGGEAVSFARRCWKPGSMSIAFCGDHVNDCGRQYLARGMGIFQTHRFPLFPGGYTWDGGPRGVRPVVRLSQNLPQVVSDLGEEGGNGFNNLPILEFTDDQAIVARSVQREVYDPIIPHINAWYTSGPKDPSKLIESVRRYTEFNRPLVGPNPAGWAAQSVRSGAVVANYVNTIRFKQEQVLSKLQLLRSNWYKDIPAIFVAGHNDTHRSYYLGDGGSGMSIPIATGDWFGFYAKEAYNQVLFINRGDPIIVRVSGGHDSFYIAVLADVEGKTMKAGDEFRFRLFSVSDALDASVSGPRRFKRVRRYLDQPEGMELVSGERQSTVGFVQVHAASADRPVAVRVPRPTEPIGVTLPLRVSGLNPRWSAGLFQLEGYTTGFYTDGRDVYTTLGFDFDGRVYASLYPDQVDMTHVRIGHPVVCDQPELILEVMPRTREGGGYHWRVAVNNPTDQAITTDFRKGMDLPGLAFANQEHTVPAGGYMILSED